MTEQAWAVVFHQYSGGMDAWARESEPNTGDEPTLVSKDERTEHDERQLAGELLDHARLEHPNCRDQIRLVKITRKPCLSPEARAARDKLCEAAIERGVLYNDAGSLLTLSNAALLYAKAVRK